MDNKYNVHNEKGFKVMKENRILYNYNILRVREHGKKYNIPQQLGSPEMVYDTIKECLPNLAYEDREHFIAISLDTKNKIIAIHTISTGDLNRSIVNPREVFRALITDGANAAILCHNHPSGDAAPSREDVVVTHRLIEGGDLLGINILDHIIIGENCYHSMKESNAM